ncbi:transglycosylase domain-containing protein [Streptomyces sp. ME18-1-4]|uniref:transglycosylase domain-containing protein n=1 Tax=Streptomyces sp. ME18-1-4 TaxID=3028685 RepID=UPI00299FFF91|nr:transglycosylase domain-containing protein [Streptomyces sp. ME18-1-4]MDX3244403.1 transglycosylase domain-containing protein [Streptomyces sp. ME18-1-4]
MQLKVPASFRADETMQLRVSDIPALPDISEGGGEGGDDKKARSSKNRRKAPRPSLFARISAALGPRLTPLLAALAPYVARVTPYARKLRPQYPRPGRTGWRRWIPSWRQWLGGFLASMGLSSLLLVVAYAATDIPDNINSYATQQDNVYFWADGTPMARTGWVQRQAMPLKDIPEDVRWAVLAAENASFYSDPGISFKGISRALFRTIGQGDTQGGSTITQQYVKNVYLNQNQTVSRKFTEAMIALKLDNQMSKDDILEGYLNTSWFGRGTYGIQRAAQAYYGKDVGELNASEAAFLASLLKGAGLYDPTLNPANRARAVERWSWTLDRMVEIGKLSKAERAKYAKFPEPLKANPLYDTGEQSDYLVELASQYAKKAGNISDKDFDLGGYQIYTTFDKKRETQLTDAVTKARKQAQKDDPKSAATAHYGASSVAADGRILAVYGGPDHRTQGYNESNATTVPAGSAFQPFVYAAGLEHGTHKTRDGETTEITGDSLYDGDNKVLLTTPEGYYWDRNGKRVVSENDGGRSYGQISLHRALARSVNTPFMQLGMDTGLDVVRSTAEKSGLLSSSFGAQVPALSMGSATPSAIRMASGYSTFAAGGKHTEPYSVRMITKNGTKVGLETPATDRAFGADVAEEVNSALADSFSLAHPDDVPSSQLQAARSGSLGRVTGKAGTTQDDTAAWYVGSAKAVSTAVVVYRIDLAKSLEPLPLKGIAGTTDDSVPYGIWSGAMSPLG